MGLEDPAPNAQLCTEKPANVHLNLSFSPNLSLKEWLKC